MPLIKNPSRLPDWCEMKFYEIIKLRAGNSPIKIEPTVHPKEKWFVCEGSCEIRIDNNIRKLHSKDQFEILRENVSTIKIHDVTEDLVLIRLCGDWGEETGGSGVFSISATKDIGNKGDPTDYPRNTRFDNHYHDYDEYYIFYDGIGVVVSEGNHYIVSEGDCIATGMGHHHDIPLVVETLKAVFFETTVLGEKRRGHLWNHTHGKANPDPTRV
ncbi:hypothetical protein ACERII_17090 [Evansella sp. AB-rgal1]|uniref:hypothetical protein n=1 Tax=Evansella sp. AB-rgal1 TaxID=3242696 RepID=UPI00359E40AA